MLIMSPTSSSSERNKQTVLINDLNHKKVLSDKCNNMVSVKASSFDAGALAEPQETLGSEPSPSS